MFEPKTSATKSQGLCRTGIRPLGDKPWGTHACLFYETAQDLLDVHAGYFGAGLADGEFCIWALSGPSARRWQLKVCASPFRISSIIFVKTGLRSFRVTSGISREATSTPSVSPTPGTPSMTKRLREALQGAGQRQCVLVPHAHLAKLL